MSYLAKLKREISQNAGRGELTELTKGASVGYVGTERDPSGDISQFEALLAIVAPAHNTPAEQYAEIREAAKGDIAGAIASFTEQARQVLAGQELKPRQGGSEYGC